MFRFTKNKTAKTADATEKTVPAIAQGTWKNIILAKDSTRNMAAGGAYTIAAQITTTIQSNRPIFNIFDIC
jgi:hypothetical protein